MYGQEERQYKRQDRLMWLKKQSNANSPNGRHHEGNGRNVGAVSSGTAQQSQPQPVTFSHAQFLTFTVAGKFLFLLCLLLVQQWYARGRLPVQPCRCAKGTCFIKHVCFFPLSLGPARVLCDEGGGGGQGLAGFLSCLISIKDIATVSLMRCGWWFAFSRG